MIKLRITLLYIEVSKPLLRRPKIEKKIHSFQADRFFIRLTKSCAPCEKCPVKSCFNKFLSFI